MYVAQATNVMILTIFFLFDNEINGKTETNRK